VECNRGDHDWGRGEEEHRSGGLIAKIWCTRCGVGHSILVRQTDARTLETQLTIFPATGSQTISRELIRAFMAMYEETNQTSESKGYRVIRGTPTIGGMPVGI